MGISDISKKAYDGVSKILKDNGQPFSKGQAYAVECLVKTIEESTEKRCLDVTKSIVAKKDQIINNQVSEASKVSEDTLKQVNEMVEQRVQELKKEIPEVLDYAKMKKLQDCIETIKESVGYASDEQVSKVASESAKMLNTTKGLIETQAKTISEKTASLGESAKTISQLREQVKQM